MAKLNMTCLAGAAALMIAAPACAETIIVAPGEGAQERLQEALILAEPGDEIRLAEGRFVLTDGLSLDVDSVILRGAGRNKSVLDFSAQRDAGEGLLITSDNVTLRDFAVENTRGDGIKSKGADAIVYYRLRVEWTGGPLETNGAYAVYPVESEDVLIDSVTVRGASDAGIYVGQSTNIIVRNSVAEYNVAGIEIENSRNARVFGNYVAHNTGGILVFDLPNLPVMGGGNVMVDHNLVINNDVPNFAPAGNIVASVPMGSGIMVMANDNVAIENNVVDGNATAGVLVVAYSQSYDDDRYDALPRRVSVSDSNHFGNNGYAPDFPGGAMLAAAFGGNIPAVMWDGLGTDALLADAEVPVLSLGYSEQGQGPESARPDLVTGTVAAAEKVDAFSATHRADIEQRARP
ncbi:MAG: parallel beta-helix domain-containing protein [Pontixanthobacter sp.]